MEMSRESVTAAIALAGLFKFMEPTLSRLLERFKKNEDKQNSEIDCIRTEVAELKKEIALIKSEKVSWKELNKMLDKLDTRFNELQKVLSKIEGKLEGGLNGQKNSN